MLRPLSALFLSLSLSLSLNQPIRAAADPWDEVAREYVRLSLGMGKHDAAFVDAWYGPESLKKAADAAALDLPALKKRSEALQTAISRLNAPDAELALRKEYLSKQTRAMLARIDMLQGKRLAFDEETAVLYDAVAPKFSREHFVALQKEVAALLPGEGPLTARIDAFREQFVIPKDKLRAVFDAAIAGCRAQTLKHLKLPEGEGFTLEFVTDKPWSGYNWYQGKYQSLIQVNIELPIYIERAIDLGCHEGYPGHHTYNALLEQKLVREKGWLEFSVYPLWSPQSLIAEGSANYGIEMAFPEAERLRFQREVLYPIAGLDPAKADLYDRVSKLLGKLSYAGNEAARAYVDGKMSADQAKRWLTEVELYPQSKAAQRIRFFDVNRGYVINYNLGKDMVKNWVEKQSVGAADAEKARWTAFTQLLASPRLPSGLQ